MQLSCYVMGRPFPNLDWREERFRVQWQREYERARIASLRRIYPGFYPEDVRER